MDTSKTAAMTDYLSAARSCESKNAFNRLHIDLEDIATPLEMAAISRQARRAPDFPTEGKGWLKRIRGLSPDMYRAPKPYGRREVLLGATLYANEDVSPFRKKLLLAFSGNAGRLMLPIAVFLQELDPQRWNCALVSKPPRTSYFDGSSGLGVDLPDTLRRLDAALTFSGYGEVVTLGTSAGGYPAIRAAGILRASRGISICGSAPASDPVPEEASPGEMGAPGDGAEAVSLYFVHPARRRPDVESAYLLQARYGGHLVPVPGADRHNVFLFAIREGTFSALMETLLGGDPSVYASVAGGPIHEDSPPPGKAMSLFARLDRHARQPGLEAAVFDDTSVTYDAFLDRVTAAAGWLVENGLRAGDVAAIAIADELDHLTISMALACLATPQVCLPAHEIDPAKHAVADRLACRQVITDRAADWMEGIRVFEVPSGGTASLPGPASFDPRQFMSFKQGAPVVYQKSSGTTSVPKVFGLTLDRLLAIAESQSNPEQARVLRTSSMEFDSTRLHRLCALIAGNTCIFSSGRDAGDIGELCRRARVSEVQIGTYKLAALMSGAGPATPLPPETRVMTGGSRVSGALRGEIRARLTTNLWVSYATSEVGPISLAAPDEHEAFPEGVGRPLPGVSVEIVDENDTEVPQNTIGRVRVRKRGVPHEYVGDASASKSFKEGWFYPGDLLSREGDGPLVYHGRVDDVMILNGINIDPVAIEDVLEAHPDVAEAIAFPVKSRAHGEIPVAAVVPSEAAGEGISRRLTDHCRAALGVRAPRYVYVVEEIPRNAAGKPLRHLAAGMVCG